MRKIKEKLSKERLRLKREGRNQAITIITTSMTFVTGLAWNEAVKSTIEHFYPESQGSGFEAKLIYALVLTFIIVLGTSFLTRFKYQEQKHENHPAPEKPKEEPIK